MVSIARSAWLAAVLTGCVEGSLLLTEPDPSSDFALRCASPAVIRCEGFDEPLAGMEGPTIDGEVRASGRGSLRFELAEGAPAGAAGQLVLQFTDDLSVQIGEGEEVWIQWRQRFSPSWLASVPGSTEWWLLRLGEGDRPDRDVSWCGELDVLVADFYVRGVPQVLHSCGLRDGTFDVFDQPIPGSTAIDVQPGGPRPCPHDAPDDGCERFVPDEWMTFQLHVRVGHWYRNDGVHPGDGGLDLWVAREGEAPVLAIARESYDFTNTGDARFGAVWLRPDHTNGTFAAASMQTWYDELIISRERVPEPSGAP
jgi:hypothetical protein